MLINVSGLSYVGRCDDLIVLPSGTKINALDLESVYNRHDGITRTAVICKIDRSAPVLLVQPVLHHKHDITHIKASTLIDYVLRHNEKLSFEKRIKEENAPPPEPGLWSRPKPRR